MRAKTASFIPTNMKHTHETAAIFLADEEQLVYILSHDLFFNTVVFFHLFPQSVKVNSFSQIHEKWPRCTPIRRWSKLRVRIHTPPPGLAVVKVISSMRHRLRVFAPFSSFHCFPCLPQVTCSHVFFLFILIGLLHHSQLW